MSSQELPNVEALLQHVAKVRQLATEALSGAIQRREAVRAELREEEQRLAFVLAERRIAEGALRTVRDDMQRRARELSAVGARFQPPPASFTPPALLTATVAQSSAAAASPVTAAVSAPAPASAVPHRAPRAVSGAGAYRHIASGLLVVLLFGLAVLLTPLSQLVGWEIFSVQSGSMEPTINVGGIVAVRPVLADQLKVGDVITFIDQNRPDTFVTHRIIELSIGDGQAQAKTKGDANDVADAWTVPTSKAVGRVDLALPYLGFVMVWLSSPLAKVAILGIAVLGLAVPSVKRHSGPTPAAAPAQTFEPGSVQPTFHDLNRDIRQMLAEQGSAKSRPAA